VRSLNFVAETTVYATSQVSDMIAVGYVRVSTADQAAGGLGLDAQRSSIEAACRRRRWDLIAIHEDAGFSAKTNYRPGLKRAVAECGSHPASLLVVAKLDRLARSLTAYANLVDQAKSENWRIVALDTPKTDTPQGEAMQAMTAVFAQLERRLIAQRTREALSVARSRGVRLGRPPALSSEVCEAIFLFVDQGWSATRIARHLQESGVQAPHGGSRWYASTITRMLRRPRTTDSDC
jgi:DNA invertase Pin-like site-specific DNA recombinase